VAHLNPSFQICTILFSYYIRQEHFRVAEFLPARNCLQEDLKRSEDDFDFLRRSYLQPDMAVDRTIYPESMEEEFTTPAEKQEEFQEAA
jgi:hypothetical protein